MRAEHACLHGQLSLLGCDFTIGTAWIEHTLRAVRSLGTFCSGLVTPAFAEQRPHPGIAVAKWHTPRHGRDTRRARFALTYINGTLEYTNSWHACCTAAAPALRVGLPSLCV